MPLPAGTRSFDSARPALRADRSPLRMTMLGWLPVPACDFLLRRRLRTAKSLRQTPQQIGCHQRMFSHPLAHHIPGESMQMNRRTNRRKHVLRMLRNHSRNHPGQNVASSAGRHPGIPRRIHPRLATRLNHQRPVPFEHHDEFMFARKLSRHAQTIFLHLGDRSIRTTAPFPPDAE